MLVQEIFPDHELLIVPFACLLWGWGGRRFFSAEGERSCGIRENSSETTIEAFLGYHRR